MQIPSQHTLLTPPLLFRPLVVLHPTIDTPLTHNPRLHHIPLIRLPVDILLIRPFTNTGLQSLLNNQEEISVVERLERLSIPRQQTVRIPLPDIPAASLRLIGFDLRQSSLLDSLQVENIVDSLVDTARSQVQWSWDSTTRT